MCLGVMAIGLLGIIPGKQMEDRGKRKSDGDTTFISEKYSFTDK